MLEAPSATATASPTTDNVSAAGRILLFGIAFAPLMWFVGIYFLWFHVLAIAAAAVFLTSPRMTIAPLAIVPAVYAGWYAMSIAVNAPGAEADRIIAAIYNLSYWLMGVSLVLVASRLPWRVASDVLVRFFIVVGVVLLGVAAVGQVAWHVFGLRQLIVPTVFSAAMPGVSVSTLLQDTSSLVLLLSDWLGSKPFPRLVGFAPYPTATAATMMFALPFLIGRTSFTSPRMRLWGRIALVGCVVALILANSRTIWLAGAVGSAIAYATYRRALAPVLFAFVAGGVIALPFAAALINAVVESRAGSSETRFELYLLQFDLIIRQSPLIGMGIKERVGSFIIPLGSHSTILGALYKTGTIGLVLILMMMATVTLYWFRAMFRVRQAEARLFLARLGVPILGMNIYLLTEDIDAPQMLCFLYFLFQGLMIAVLADPATRMRQTEAPRQTDQGQPLGATGWSY